MILIVDDDYDIASLIRFGLEKVGLSASSFSNPLMALEAFTQKPSDYDLVICDIRMPAMNGYEFVQQLKKVKPDVSVFLMSSFEFDDLPNTLSSSDIQGYLEKPISIHEINQTVLEHIRSISSLKWKSDRSTDKGV